MRKLRVGTDCSGIEAPIQALIQLGIPFKHVFSSDIDKYCIKSIKSNYKPKILFGDPDGHFKNGDITKRDIDDVPDIDLYVCGFPCQPFSQAGNRLGIKDKRGNVFLSCLELITVKQPKYFILENVKGILSIDKENKKDKYGKTWKNIIKSLESLDGYNIHWKIMNTKDYGIPQNRERVYIIGTKKNDFNWPKPIKMKDIKKYVDKTDTTTFKRTRIIRDETPSDAVFIDLNFSRLNTYINSNKWAPCLNTGSGMWCVVMSRYANMKECFGLQGFTNFKESVSFCQLRKQIGNSMSVNVLKKIINNLIA
jgi:DNA (cytosine-5)-methyltransferase 1